VKKQLILIAMVGGLGFSGCAANQPTQSNNQSAGRSVSVPPAMPQNAEVAKLQNNDTAQNIQTPAIPRQQAQLIKKVAMGIVVESVDKTIAKVTEIINQQQGDLIKLIENQPKNELSRHTATIQLRVPFQGLETTLNELSKLGSVKSRNITAEDVGTRIVDFQAQLSNLRRTEANLQKIMDKTGSVRDTLSVSRELSNVRDSIERIDAQLKNIQNQVAYSTVTLNVEAAVSSKNPQRGFGLQVQESWNKSTSSVGTFSMKLVKLGIWLIAYSPYLLIIVAGIYVFTRWQRVGSRE
jgi:archaellum component FlaC